MRKETTDNGGMAIYALTATYEAGQRNILHHPWIYPFSLPNEEYSRILRFTTRCCLSSSSLHSILASRLGGAHSRRNILAIL